MAETTPATASQGTGTQQPHPKAHPAVDSEAHQEAQGKGAKGAHPKAHQEAQGKGEQEAHPERNAEADADVDSGEERDPEVARVAQTEEQQRVLFSGMLAEEYYAHHGVKHSASFIRNSRGMRLFTQIWTPAKNPPRSLICCLHGFGNDSSWMFQLMCVRLAASGYAVCALDYEGHGRSDGLHGSFKSADVIATDCLTFFRSVYSSRFKGLPCFLIGESMGGAFALLIISMCETMTDPESLAWNGLILLSPMLKIKDEMRPHWLLVTLLQGLVLFIPNAPIVPTPDTIKMSCRDPERLEIAMANPHRYAMKPRLGVAVELVRVTDRMAELIPQVTIPFLVVHGEADLVTDCFSSKELFLKAASTDKTLRLYPEGGHQLLQGEALELREQVWGDVLGWIQARVRVPASAAK